MKTRRSLLVGRATLAHQELASAVIHRALLDVGDPRLSDRVRQSARTFVDGSVACAHWCAVAGLDPRLVMERAQLVLDRSRKS